MGKEENIEIIYLFFADDILVFCQPDVNMLLNLKCIFLCF